MLDPAAPAEAASIQIIVNGERLPIRSGQTLVDFLQLLQLDPARVAVERNRAIVRRDRWSGTVLEPGDCLEVVQFVGGG